MVSDDWFKDLPEDFEESVRIDREEQDHRRRAIKSYHVTADSRRFIGDFINRTLGQADDMRTGSNYWLYGYYGNGKSHLLAVLDGLLDTEWLHGQHDEIWDALAPESSAESNGFGDLRDSWKQVHDEFHVIPISVNLLKYQGQKQRSFSEIVLRHAHQNPLLTGIDDEISTGLSSQLDVAYFEDWYRTTEAWSERQERAADVITDVTPPRPKYEWSEDAVWTDIQQYGALADVVLPRLFEEITGTRDGYTDLQPSDIDPEEVVSRLELLRSERERELGEPVKLVLLLDEVSLFIGTDFERLTELQTLAENVDEIGDGDVQLVATAQAKIEDVQPQFAAHGADFSIVKDRFPHRYQLPSKHVGDIAKRRLFEKSSNGEAEVRRVLDSADLKPAESLVYNEIKQNTKAPLNSVDDEDLVEFYPFLPYHAPLFLEILFNLRREASDPAKSIFSGTARAILALMHGLLRDWVDEGKEDHLVSLVDFYELVKPELRDILAQDMRVIEGSDATRGIADEVEDGNLEKFDLKVAKAVLLLQHVHNIVPMNEGNLAVAVMSDLNGRAWISTANRVEDSLERLQKYIRPTDDESGPRFRFATQEERLIYDDAEEKEDNPEWDAILETVDEHLWGRITQELSLPESVPYGESGDEYPVTYGFSVDGTAFETAVEEEGGLDVHIEVQGIHPDRTGQQTDEETLYWEIDAEGLDDLRKRLVEWWALRDAVETRDAPPAVNRDLDQRAETVRSKVVSAMSSGTRTVKDRADIGSLSNAVQEAVSVTYPDDFHPLMLQVNEDRLRELGELDSDDPLPAWAQPIQIPSADQTAGRGKKSIQTNVFSLTGRQLEDEDAGIALETVLDGIVEEKPYYDDVQLALRAILWGFCRQGKLLLIDEDGNTLENETVLQTERSTTTRLELLEVENIGKLLEEYGFKQTTETVADGLINLQRANDRLQSKVSGLQEDVRLVIDTDVHAPAVVSLLESFESELNDRVDATTDRLVVVKSQGEGLPDAIRETAEIQNWFDDVSDTWNRRLSNVYEWDAQLTVGDSRFEWLDEPAHAAIDARRKTITGFSGEWWTSDGWGTLVEELGADPTDELEGSWEGFGDERGLNALVERIQSHPWIVPATELDTFSGEVHRAFERRFITPLRRFEQWYETIDAAIISLLDGDSEKALDAADEVATIDSLSDTLDIDLSELEFRLDHLSSMVGDRTPDAVDQIGVIPGDRQQLDRRLERLIEQGDLDIEATDSGVIVR